MVKRKAAKRIKRGAHFQDDIPAAPAVAAIRPAARHVFFAVEVHHAIPAFAGMYQDLCFIYEHDFSMETLYRLFRRFLNVGCENRTVKWRRVDKT